LPEKLRDECGPKFWRVPKWVEALRFILAHQLDLKTGYGFTLWLRRIRGIAFQRADGAGFFDGACGR